MPLVSPVLVFFGPFPPKTASKIVSVEKGQLKFQQANLHYWSTLLRLFIYSPDSATEREPLKLYWKAESNFSFQASRFCFIKRRLSSRRRYYEWRWLRIWQTSIWVEIFNIENHWQIGKYSGLNKGGVS